MGILSLNIFFAGAGNAATFPFRAIIGVEALELSNMTYAAVMAINAFAGAAAGVALGWLLIRSTIVVGLLSSVPL